MTFDEALEILRNQDEYLRDHPDNITLPLAEQIEANRKAIEALQKTMGCMSGPGFPQEVLAARAILPILPTSEIGQAPGVQS